MSTSKVWLTTIEDVRVHPNADALELATVHGWQVAVKKGQYQNSDRVAYFEQGISLPRNVAEKFNVINYLSEKTDINNERKLVVHRVKLRGEPSFGLVVSVPSELDDMAIESDITAFYGASKYEPPLRDVVDGIAPDHPLFTAYTDIENLRSYPHVFQQGEQVVATEKIHGINVRVGFVREVNEIIYMVGSRRYRREEPRIYADDPFWYPLSLVSVQRFLADMAAQGVNQAVLYGEVYGPGIQPYHYQQNAKAFRAFDVMVDGQYWDNDEFRRTMETYAIPVVPVDYEGAFSIEAIRAASETPSTVGNQQGREGLVVRPKTERNDPLVGRVILKYVSDQYLFGKAATNDTTDA